MSHKIHFESLNFYWREKQSCQNNDTGIPEFLPFSLEWNSKTNLLQQSHNDYVDECLHKVYQLNENVGYLQDGHDLAELYGGDFIRFFTKHVQSSEAGGKSLLEIGCGGCYLLEKFRSVGLHVEGCDPSPIAEDAAIKKSIPLTKEFYSSEKINQKFDFIVHYDVLEHIYEPELFLKSHLDNLNEDGAIVFAVPNCTNSILKGDISMFLHEHVNYFDEESLRLVVQLAGFDVLDISSGSGVGTLYCYAKKSSKKTEVVQDFDDTKFEKFKVKLEENLSKIKEWIGEGTGIYIPLRALPYLCVLGINEGVRFFDDNSDWHGKYFDGFDIAVESFDELMKFPPKKVVIFSYVFADKIMKKINDFDASIEIVSLLDL
ncbi:methyltransferase domain-containing protein [Paraneptunicella aestuarii]|uniref:methyltransferase domain-containing protein n=1 Tax=Paraneptunicella aestuarii TaxID=2831148 RepID=UPI001E4F0CE4|nr:methyltransferase domain-containing protein [Paraneptunicella aestuarii]UAA39676.1 methyltransferase domain-containing protein [Paraneptunicella aestuarii]